MSGGRGCQWRRALVLGWFCGLAGPCCVCIVGAAAAMYAVLGCALIVEH